MKHDEQRKDGSDSHPEKADQADDRQEREGHSNTEPFQQAAGQEDLNADRKRVHGQIDPREKGGARGAIVKSMSGDIGLLKINEGGGDRVQEHERADAEQIGRTKRVRDSGQNTAADRPLFCWLMSILSLQIGGEKPDALRGDLKHQRRNQ